MDTLVQKASASIKNILLSLSSIFKVNLWQTTSNVAVLKMRIKGQTFPSILHFNLKSSSSKMNSFIAILALCAAAVSGDVTVNVDTVMCNCAAPNNDNYVRMHEAHVECGSYPEGAAGHASCITNFLGFVSIFL